MTKKACLKVKLFRSQFLSCLLALDSEQQFPGVEWPRKLEEEGTGGARPALPWADGESGACGPHPTACSGTGILIAIHSEFSLRKPLRCVRISRQIINCFTCLTSSSLFCIEIDIRSKRKLFSCDKPLQRRGYASPHEQKATSSHPWGKRNRQLQLLGEGARNSPQINVYVVRE